VAEDRNVTDVTDHDSRLPPSSRVVDEDAWEDAGAEDTWDWVLTSLEDASPAEADILEVHEDMELDENEAKRDEEFQAEEEEKEMEEKVIEMRLRQQEAEDAEKKESKRMLKIEQEQRQAEEAQRKEEERKEKERIEQQRREASQTSQLPLAGSTLAEEVSRKEMKENEGKAVGKYQCQRIVNVLCAAVEEQLSSDVATAGIDFEEERSSFLGEALRSKDDVQSEPPKRRSFGKAPGGVPSGSVDELAAKLQKRFVKVEEEGLVLLKSQLPSQADARASSAEEAKAARMPKWGQSTAQLLYASKRHSWFDFEELDEEEQKIPG